MAIIVAVHPHNGHILVWTKEGLQAPIKSTRAALMTEQDAELCAYTLREIELESQAITRLPLSVYTVIRCERDG